MTNQNSTTNLRAIVTEALTVQAVFKERDSRKAGRPAYETAGFWYDLIAAIAEMTNAQFMAFVAANYSDVVQCVKWHDATYATVVAA